MKYIIPILVILVVANCGDSKYGEDDLMSDIKGIIDTSGGTVAVAFEDLVTGRSLFINEKEMMHAASTMKTPVMIEVFKQAEAGTFSIDDSILVKNEFRSIVDGSVYSMDFGEDSDDEIYKHLGERLPIRELVYQMITVSSNLATNILVDLVDAKNVMETMTSIGAERIQVLRGVEDIKAYRLGMNNTTDAYDMLLVMKAIALKQVVTPSACDAMIGILSEQKFRDKIPALLPKDVTVAHKTGSITEIDHDAAIVYPAPHHPYVLVVLTRGIPDHKVAQETIAKISKHIYDFVIDTENGS
ncbi:MAG: serine hydrolase [candidate division KSB1 bacterium]|nr:serine hydrolase [candidate division KSB1 bacterium]